MLRLWWQQPSKQTKSECSALRPDKRGECATCCALCVRERKTQTPTRTQKHKHKHESSRRAETGAKGKRIICFRLPSFVCFTFVIFACLLYHFFSLSLSFIFLHTVFICSQSEHILHWLPGCHLLYEWWILAHTYSQDIHIDKVLSLSRRASLLYETNLEQLTEEAESRE